ncbi:MAG: phosphotransferase [Sandaracinaceae bacterium]|nr:phosphotransferase [Sandaracinaceae bacterium]
MMGLRAGESTDPPLSILLSFGIEATASQRIALGQVHATWVVTDTKGVKHVVQRVHPSFPEGCEMRLELVTAHLLAHGWPAPRLLRNKDGLICSKDPLGHRWRVMSYLDGESFAEFKTAHQARSAASLLARFIETIRTLNFEALPPPPIVHNPTFHLQALEEAIKGATQVDEVFREEALRLAESLIELIPIFHPHNPSVPYRNLHGDPKASNLIFRNGEAWALVDLDAVGPGLLHLEVGDALRSHAIVRDNNQAVLDEERLRAGLWGFIESAREWLSVEEARAIPLGIYAIALELSARYLRDVFEDQHFGWDPKRFPSRRAHNLERARLYFGLAKWLKGRLAAIEKTTEALITRFL